MHNFIYNILQLIFKQIQCILILIKHYKQCCTLWCIPIFIHFQNYKSLHKSNLMNTSWQFLIKPPLIFQATSSLEYIHLNYNFMLFNSFYISDWTPRNATSISIKLSNPKALWINGYQLLYKIFQISATSKAGSVNTYNGQLTSRWYGKLHLIQWQDEITLLISLVIRCISKPGGFFLTSMIDTVFVVMTVTNTLSDWWTIASIKFLMGTSSNAVTGLWPLKVQCLLSKKDHIVKHSYSNNL